MKSFIKLFLRCCNDSNLLEWLADLASFYGNENILKILEPKSRSLPLENMMMRAIESDSSEAVAVVRRMLKQNLIPVSQIMIDTAQKRKVADIINILSPGQFDAEQEKNNLKQKILNGSNKSIAGIQYWTQYSIILRYLGLIPKSEDFDYGKNKEGFRIIFEITIIKCFIL